MRNLKFILTAIAVAGPCGFRVEASCMSDLRQRFDQRRFAVPIEICSEIPALKNVTWKKEGNSYLGLVVTAWGDTQISIGPDFMRIAVDHPKPQDVRIHPSLMVMVQREIGPLDASPNLNILRRQPFEPAVLEGWFLRIQRGIDSPSGFETRIRYALIQLFDRIPNEILMNQRVIALRNSN